MTFLEKLGRLWDLRGLFLESLGYSLIIAFSSLLLGFVIGVVVAVVKIAPKNTLIMKILDKIAGIYVTRYPRYADARAVAHNVQFGSGCV